MKLNLFLIVFIFFKGNALSHLAESVPTNDGSVLDLFTFFLYKSLNDRNQVVKDKMLDASIACLNFHGRSHINELLPLFENFLQNTPNVNLNLYTIFVYIKLISLIFICLR